MNISAPIRAKILGYAKIYEPIDSHTNKYFYITITTYILTYKNKDKLFGRTFYYRKNKYIELLYPFIDTKQRMYYCCIACEFGDFKMAKFLSSLCIRGEIQRNMMCYHTDILYLASKNGYYDIVEFVIDKTIVIHNTKIDEARQIAQKNGYTKITNLLDNLEKKGFKIDEDFYYNTVIMDSSSPIKK